MPDVTNVDCLPGRAENDDGFTPLCSDGRESGGQSGGQSGGEEVSAFHGLIGEVLGVIKRLDPGKRSAGFTE